MLFVFLVMPLIVEAVHIVENFFNIDSREWKTFAMPLLKTSCFRACFISRYKLEHLGLSRVSNNFLHPFFSRAQKLTHSNLPIHNNAINNSPRFTIRREGNFRKAMGGSKCSFNTFQSDREKFLYRKILWEKSSENGFFASTLRK